MHWFERIIVYGAITFLGLLEFGVIEKEQLGFAPDPVPEPARGPAPEWTPEPGTELDPLPPHTGPGPKPKPPDRGPQPEPDPLPPQTEPDPEPTAAPDPAQSTERTPAPEPEQDPVPEPARDPQPEAELPAPEPKPDLIPEPAPEPPPAPKDAEFLTLTVRAIRVVDAEGNVLLELGASDKGGYVLTKDDAGEQTGFFGTAANSGVGLMQLYGGTAEAPVEMASDDHGGYVLLRNARDKPGTQLGVREDGGGYVSVHDMAGASTGELHAGVAGGFVSLFNRSLKQVAYVGVSRTTKGGLLQVNASDASIRSEVGETPRGGYVSIVHATGKTAVGLGINAEAKGFCVTRNRSGNQTDVLGLR